MASREVAAQGLSLPELRSRPGWLEERLAWSRGGSGSFLRVIPGGKQDKLPVPFRVEDQRSTVQRALDQESARPPPASRRLQTRRQAGLGGPVGAGGQLLGLSRPAWTEESPGKRPP